MGATGSDQARIVSLDQFRGYTVLGMFLVNFIGHFTVIQNDLPLLKHHHTYCSYADTIMPQFLFAVGFAYRLTLLRRLKTDGTGPAYLHVVKRNLGLILIGMVIYPLGSGLKNWADLATPKFGEVLLQWFKRDVFQTLVHIGVTAFWVLPVITARPAVRVGSAVCSGLLHLGLSYWFNYDWVHANPRGIDGGPLGFLTWTIPMLAGSLAYDIMNASSRGLQIGRLVGWGLVLMLVGYGLSCLHLVPASQSSTEAELTIQRATVPLVHVPPTPPSNLFTMSQRAGSVSYLTFGAGFSLALYALFVLACDVGRIQVGVFRTLGSNALVAYILHGMVERAVLPFAPKDAPMWFAWVSFGVFAAICYVFLRFLEKNKLFLRL